MLVESLHVSSSIVFASSFVAPEINSATKFYHWKRKKRSVTPPSVTQVANLHLSTSSWTRRRLQPGAVKRFEWPKRSGPHVTPQRPQCSFPFHLECEIVAGAALTSALRGQLLKSDVRLSG